MSEPQPNKTSSNRYVIVFIIILSFVCALILSILSSALQKSQEIAKELDRNQQMMIAAHVMDYEGYFLVENDKGEFVRAKYQEGGYLAPGTPSSLPDQAEMLEIFRKRFLARLTDNTGKIYTFKEAGIDEKKYIEEYRKAGYYKQRYKLFYEIMPNQKSSENKLEPVGYVIPVNGYGLWDAIYGYLALDSSANIVIGTTWYDQKETPGLGANISEPEWQSQFPGKHIFQENADGTTDFATAPVGITVVKGKVNEVMGDAPKAKSAVDGMSGATLTGNGVTAAYKNVLNAYRPFLLRVHREHAKEEKQASLNPGLVLPGFCRG